MRRTSVRTLLLLVALLACTVVQQVTKCTPVAKAGAVWLNEDPNEPNEPPLPPPERV